MKFAKIALVAALSIASVGAFAQSQSEWDDILNGTGGTVVENTTHGAVTGSVAATSVCAFAGNSSFALTAPTTARIGTTQAFIARSLGGRAGNLTVAGYGQVSVVPTVTVPSTFAAFGSGTMSGHASFNQVIEGGTAPTTGRSIASGTTYDVDLVAASVSLYVPNVLVHSTTGFTKVGTIPVSLAVTCK